MWLPAASHEEALAMAKDALDGCLEVDISHGNAIPPPAYEGGVPRLRGKPYRPVATASGTPGRAEPDRHSPAARPVVPGVPAPRKPSESEPDGEDAGKDRPCLRTGTEHLAVEKDKPDNHNL